MRRATLLAALVLAVLKTAALSCPYSPEFVEYEFCEVQIQDRA
jgi:hypothetical protein